MIKKIDSVIGVIINFMAYCSAFLTLFLMGLIVTDVVGRSVFHKAIIGTPVFARNALIALIFLALPWVTRQTKHMRSELLVDRSKGLLQKCLNLGAYFAGIVVFAGFSFALWRPMLAAFRLGEMDVEGTAFIPIAPFYIICVLGSVLSCYGIIRSFIFTLRNPNAGSCPVPKEPEAS